MLPPMYPHATPRLIPNTCYGGRFALPPIGMLTHVQVGYSSLYEEFANPAHQKSAHLWISKDGAVEQYVPLDFKAWHAVAGNTRWIGVEGEGVPETPMNGIQLAEYARFYNWARGYLQWPLIVSDAPMSAGIGTHSMGGAAWGGHSCPGPIRSAQRQDIIDLLTEVEDMPLTDADVAKVANAVKALLDNDYRTEATAEGFKPFPNVGSATARLQAQIATILARQTNPGGTT
jgi:hypothetical protein